MDSIPWIGGSVNIQSHLPTRRLAKIFEIADTESSTRPILEIIEIQSLNATETMRNDSKVLNKNYLKQFEIVQNPVRSS